MERRRNNRHSALYLGTNAAIALDNSCYQEDIANAQKLATVKMTGNISGTQGGAIGTNGNVQIGTKEPEPDEILLQKIWNDNENEAGCRPEEITAVVTYGSWSQKVTLNALNNWKRVYRLPEGILEQPDAKVEITEVSADRYELDPDSVKVSEPKYGRMELSFTNNFIPADGLTVYKVWDDNSNQDGLRPTSVQVQLLENGNASGVPVTLNNENNWSYTWEDLPESRNGVALTYTVKEVSKVEGYAVNVGEVQKYDDDSFAVTITNTHTPNTVSRTVKKFWNDADNKDKLRPESVKIQLMADGSALGETVTLNAENQWTYTWNDLPQMSQGKEIDYTAKEVEVPGGYTVSYSEDTFTITNTHTPTPTKPTKPTKPSKPSKPEGPSGGDSDGDNPKTPINPTPVPMANIPEVPELVVLPDEEVPLAALPKTGRTSANGLVLLLSSVMLAAFAAAGRKKEDEQ